MDGVKTSVEQKRKQLIEDIQTLPVDRLQEAADIISQLQKEVVAEIEQPPVQPSLSPYEAFKKSGFIGCGEGPSDLAANHKQYLEEGWKDKYGYR